MEVVCGVLGCRGRSLTVLTQGLSLTLLSLLFSDQGRVSFCSLPPLGSIWVPKLSCVVGALHVWDSWAPLMWGVHTSLLAQCLTTLLKGPWLLQSADLRPTLHTEDFKSVSLLIGIQGTPHHTAPA